MSHQIKPIYIDFYKISGCPKACFKISDFCKKCIYVKSYSIIGWNNVKKDCQKTITSKSGKFKIYIPYYVSSIKIVIKIKIDCDNNIILSQQFEPYSYSNLIWRTYEGSSNNMSHPNWGLAGYHLLRICPAAYSDGYGSMAVRGPNNPNPRSISNAICQGPSVSNPFKMTDITWLFGQFIDHLLDLTHSSGEEPENIITPSDDQYPGYTISFTRSDYVPNNGGIREQPNNITSYIDASNVYRSSAYDAMHLRCLDGTGKMKTSTADNGEKLLPYNVDGLPNAAGSFTGPADQLFIAGDVRANENILLTAIHTLFVREHNRLCDEIICKNPSWKGIDDLIYQKARHIVAGYMQNITYNEFLPALLGPHNLKPYKGYDPHVNASVSTEFSTVGYRIGHTMLSSSLKIGAHGGSKPLRDSFFNPTYIKDNGIEALLHGACLQVMQEIDGILVEDVRTFLFGPPTNNMLLDLAAINIQRGRDHGIAGYNVVRQAYGLSRKYNFQEITSDVSIQQKLQTLYGHPDYIDPWIGGLVETHLPGADVGELFTAIISDQFHRSRAGDRYYFEVNPALTKEEIDDIRCTTLSHIIKRNTKLGNKIQRDVFHFCS